MQVIHNDMKNNPKINQSTFRPIKPLEGKSNYKRYFRIEKNGSVKERIFLNVPDISLREEIICKHYLSFLVRNFIQNPVGMSFTARDNPWDFGVKLSNGLLFNVEITSIADNQWLYEKIKREEEFEKNCCKKFIPLRKLKKIHLWFGGKESQQVIKKSEEESIKADKQIINPFYNQSGRIYISDTKDEPESLSNLIIEAIQKKICKNHNNVENTILIIDNRTSRFEIEDYHKTMSELEAKFEDVNFPEVYFYTGYCSDNDGNNAEYSFAPIKLPKEKWEQLERKIESKDIIILNENGIVYS